MGSSTSTPAERGSEHERSQQGNRQHDRQPVAAFPGSDGPGHDDRTGSIREEGVCPPFFDTATKPQRTPYRSIFSCFTSCIKI